MAPHTAALLAKDIERLQAIQRTTAKQPSIDELIDATRLLLRYRSGAFGQSARSCIQQLLEHWQLSEAEAFRLAREQWASGYRPAHMPAANVGSGADVNDE